MSRKISTQLHSYGLEGIRDYGAQSAADILTPPQTKENLELITVPHELGHQFGLDPGGQDGHKQNTLMEDSVSDTNKVFDEQQILLLRSDRSAIEN